MSSTVFSGAEKAQCVLCVAESHGFTVTRRN